MKGVEAPAAGMSPGEGEDVISGRREEPGGRWLWEGIRSAH